MVSDRHPLPRQVIQLPHAQHVNEVLLRNVVLLVNIPLKRSKYISLLHDVLPASTLYLEEGGVGDALFVGGCAIILWRYSEIFEFFSKHDDGLFAQKWVLRGGRAKVGGGPVQQMLLGGEQAG